MAQDFGLSKVVDDGHTQGMELTSQARGLWGLWRGLGTASKVAQPRLRLPPLHPAPPRPSDTAVPQGAGTYWYLPPECFVVCHDAAPMISNKVGVQWAGRGGGRAEEVECWGCWAIWCPACASPPPQN